MDKDRKIAYFSMEIGLSSDLPTYSGGLGVLAGDTLRAAADLSLPMVAVTLLYRQGFFYQHINEEGWQIEKPAHWAIDDVLTELPERVSVQIADRTVQIRAWQYTINGITGHSIPVYFLDSDLEENAEIDRQLCGSLYAGDRRYRLAQEIVLGIGGVRMLERLGHSNLNRYHMNEGHAALLAFELLVRFSGDAAITDEVIQSVRQQCIFTTHTPVPAGHDIFENDLARELLDKHPSMSAFDALLHEGRLNMTYLALKLSHYVNGVAQKHGEISRQMLQPEDGEHPYVIDAITNGVHLASWVAPATAALLDEHLPQWREDHHSLRYSHAITADNIWEVHQNNKLQMIHYINNLSNSGFDKDILTIGFARRFTAYKRPMLLFHDLDRLRRIAREQGGLQIVYAGKAHPHDHAGKMLMQEVWRLQETLLPEIKLILLPNYSLADARLLVAGVDLWLNTPMPPMEASGTSGMKAAANGVPSLSVLDGWWIEGCVEGVTGWAIGNLDDGGDTDEITRRHALSLYDKLEHAIAPLYYEQQAAFAEIMCRTMAINASFFNTHRMLQEYVAKAYT